MMELYLTDSFQFDDDNNDKDDAFKAMSIALYQSWWSSNNGGNLPSLLSWWLTSTILTESNSLSYTFGSIP